MMQERPYQDEAVDSVLSYWGEGGGNPLVEMATGTGKSVVIGKLNQRLLTAYPTLRVLVVTHRKELIQQDATTALRVWPQMPLGINSAGLGKRDYNSQVLFAGINSIYDKAARLGARDVVMIDECHLVPPDGEGMYRTLLSSLRENVPDLRVVGFTATGYRLDSGRLDEGDGRLFDDIVYSYDLAKAVEDGFLKPLIAKATSTEIDVKGVARRGGEFVESELARAADKADVIAGACDEIVAKGDDRRAWLAFCTGIEHAMHVRDALRLRSVSCEAVHSKQANRERDDIINAYKAGRIQCLTNANILTTGFDAPQVDLIAMLRPTLSTSLYVQILGRGTRLSDGKDNCLVLDFAGNVRRHGPVDAVTVTHKKKGNGGGEKTDPDTVRAKICPECQSYNNLSTLVCVVCGFEWPKEEPRHSDRSDDAPVMTREIKDKWIAVDDVRLNRHRKDIDSLRVDYFCGRKIYSEWVCLEHGKASFPRAKAEAWWLAMSGRRAPDDIDEAISRVGELNPVQAIMIARDGQYWRVIAKRIQRNDGREFKVDDKFRVTPLPSVAMGALPL